MQNGTEPNVVRRQIGAKSARFRVRNGAIFKRQQTAGA